MSYKIKGGWRFLNQQELEEVNVFSDSAAWHEDMRSFIGKSAMEIYETESNLVDNKDFLSRLMTKKANESFGSFRIHTGDGGMWSVFAYLMKWDYEIELIFPDIDFSCQCEEIDSLKVNDSFAYVGEGRFSRVEAIRHNKDMSKLEVKTVSGDVLQKDEINFISEETYSEFL